MKVHVQCLSISISIKVNEINSHCAAVVFLAIISPDYC